MQYTQYTSYPEVVQAIIANDFYQANQRRADARADHEQIPDSYYNVLHTLVGTAAEDLHVAALMQQFYGERWLELLGLEQEEYEALGAAHADVVCERHELLINDIDSVESGAPCGWWNTVGEVALAG